MSPEKIPKKSRKKLLCVIFFSFGLPMTPMCLTNNKGSLESTAGEWGRVFTIVPC